MTLMNTTSAPSATGGTANSRSMAVRICAAIACIGALWIGATIIWMAVSAAVGLVALGAIALGAVAALQAIPYLGQRWENALLKARKAEARRNPIEELQNTFIYRSKQLGAFQNALTSIGAQIEGMRDMLAEQRRSDASHDLSKQEAALKRMEGFYEKNLARLAERRKALEDYKKAIERKVFEWEFAQAGKSALASLNAADQESILREMLSDEAMRTVQQNFNEVFAEFDAEASAITKNKQLEFGANMVLDVQSIEIPTLQTIQRD